VGACVDSPQVIEKIPVIDLDKIYLLESGEIIAQGNHEELLASSPLYQEIYDSQLGSGVTSGLELEEVA
jgi:hypothetical protein